MFPETEFLTTYIFKGFICFFPRAGTLTLREDPSSCELMHCAITLYSPWRIFLVFSQAELVLFTITRSDTLSLMGTTVSVAEKVIPIQTWD